MLTLDCEVFELIYIFFYVSTKHKNVKMSLKSDFFPLSQERLSRISDLSSGCEWNAFINASHLRAGLILHDFLFICFFLCNRS